MIGDISLLVGYLIAILNMALLLLFYFMLLEVIRDLKLLEMPAAMIIPACVAFVIVIGVPLVGALGHLLKDPQSKIYEVVLRGVAEAFPLQLLLIIIGTSIWAVFKNWLLEKQKGRNER